MEVSNHIHIMHLFIQIFKFFILYLLQNYLKKLPFFTNTILGKTGLEFKQFFYRRINTVLITTFSIVNLLPTKAYTMTWPLGNTVFPGIINYFYTPMFIICRLLTINNSFQPFSINFQINHHPNKRSSYLIIISCKFDGKLCVDLSFM